eukprot:4236263-Pyramimonas_sp.AAC.1
MARIVCERAFAWQARRLDNDTVKINVTKWWSELDHSRAERGKNIVTHSSVASNDLARSAVRACGLLVKLSH